MTTSNKSSWCALIEDEVQQPQRDACPMAAEDRLYRLYPQYTDWVRRIPVAIPSLLQDRRIEVIVRKIYHHVLLRDPDSDGFVHHVGRLSRDEISPFNLLMEFRLSPEGTAVKRLIKHFWWYRLVHFVLPFLPSRLRSSERLIGIPIKER